MNRRRLFELDILRAFLTFWVVVCHCMEFCGWRYSDGILIAGILHAEWAVNVFMVLSGFVITKLIVERPEPYSAYIFRRFMRLYPCYAFCILLALSLRPITFGSSPLMLWEASETRFWWQHWIAHITLLHGIPPHALLPYSAVTLLAPAWSISVEWQYYLFAPLIVALVLRLQKRKGVLIGLLALSVVTIGPMIGWRLRLIWPVSSIVIIKIFFLGLGTAAYFLWRQNNVPQFLPRVRVLEWMGTISYSTYLVHWPILAVLAALLHVNRGFTFVLILIGGLLTYAMSAAMYYGIEKPCITFGKKVLF
jgi:peptidoglycan/LPS O-acetylase OafA/YrhL